MEEPKFTRGEKGYITRITNQLKININKELIEIEELKEELKSDLIRNNTLIKKLEEKHTDADELLEEVKDIRNKIYEPDSYDIVLADEIETFIGDNNKFKDKRDTIYDEIMDFHKNIFGYKNKNGKTIEGFKSKFSYLYANNTKKQEELFQRIEGLLKGASTVALAKSFKEHKKSFNFSNVLWIMVFVLSIVSMMGLSIWGFIRADYQFEDMWKYTLGNIPFLAGAVWLAIYSGKQRSQNKRLQQEYAYKEDVAKIYYGLKQEIESLGKSDLGTKLNQQILETIITVVAHNPSNTLESKSHEDKGPILESLDKLTEVYTKSNNI